MAAYFHGNSDLQGGDDGLQTLILMNPAYVGYSDNLPPVGGNFVFINSNSAGNGLNPSYAPASSQIQHFVGVPLRGTSDQQEASSVNGLFPRLQSNNLYSQQIEMAATAAARDGRRPNQCLSLSLSSQQPVGFGSYGFNREAPSQPLLPPGSQQREDDARVSGGSPPSASVVSNCVNTLLLSSKYLKATQELLDEVVKPGKLSEPYNKPPIKIGVSSSIAAGNGGDGLNSELEDAAKHGTELTTGERQEIQMKKAKLVNMLDKVDQKYREYRQQMQVIVSMFEQAAGIGSARTYTSLALETISKQFRCLKDSILLQIRATSKLLGEEEGKLEPSKLKYMDSQIRQQRALQQLGMIQHNAWRPQRGLPERSVSVLRAWLFEHFLHPYPKDSDKIMLAKQTGLTRSQVSNWFINARVRLWKPMVEEMYMEEVKEQERTESGEKTSKSDTSSNQEISGSTKKQRNSDMLDSLTGIATMNIDSKSTQNLQMSLKFGNGSKDAFSLLETPTNFNGGFGSYPISELGRFDQDQFYSGNAVSLTLGLQHCENRAIPGSHQSFQAMSGPLSSDHPNIVYEQLYTEEALR